MDKEFILQKAKNWFRESIAEQHIKNSEKLANPRYFNINPFLVRYLANFLTGNSSAESIAKALIYPRVLGTSITTSFGNSLQRFTSDVLEGFGSAVSGIDVEFVDAIDGRKKYCQLKAGPNTINKDDVETISGHFTSVKNLARTNNLPIAYGDLIVGVLYGTESDLSSHYKRLTSMYDYPVFVGQQFWLRLTGDADFYDDLILEFSHVAEEVDGSGVIETAVKKLADTPEIQAIARLD